MIKDYDPKFLGVNKKRLELYTKEFIDKYFLKCSFIQLE